MQVYPAENILICTSLGSYLPDKALGVCMGGAGADGAGGGGVGGNIGILLGGGRGGGGGGGGGGGLHRFSPFFKSHNILSSKHATSLQRGRGA